MSRIISYPNLGTLRLYQVNNYVHMSSLKKYFNHLSHNTSHRTTYKFVEPNKFIPLKHHIDEQIFPHDDHMFIRSLQVFQRKLDVPFDSKINIEAKRHIVQNISIFKDKYWSTFGVSKVGIMNIAYKNIHNVQYVFRDQNNNYINKNALIALFEGQMIGYDENNVIEHSVSQVNIINPKDIGIYDQLIFTV